MTSIAGRFAFTVAILTTAISTLLIYATWSSSHAQMEEAIASNAALAFQFDSAVREYVAECVHPGLQERVGEGVLVPREMSEAFVAQCVLEKVNEKFPDYLLKFSSENPRNPANAAGPEELEILRYFRANPEATEWTGKIEIDGKEYFACFSPRRMQESCLPCHGRSEDAPRPLLERYGAEAGFDWSPGDVVAMDTIAIPTARAHTVLQAQWKRQAFTLAICLVALFASVLMAFRWIVGRRLANIARHFREVAEQDESLRIAPVEVRNRDEIGVLAASFNALALRLECLHESLDERVKARTAELNAEIAERREAEQKLRDSEVKFRALFESSRDAVMVLNEQEFLDCNQATLEVFGCSTRDEFLRKHPSEFSPPLQPDGRDSRIAADEKIATALREGINAFEWLHCRLNGTEFPAHVLLSAMEIGERTLLQAVVRDMTGQKRRDEERAARRSQLEGINRLHEELLSLEGLEEKLNKITSAAVDLFALDFCRVWMTQPADLCETGCFHADVKEGPHVCLSRDQCLHLLASSGRYTHTDGSHRRVPLGCYKIGRIAADTEASFLTNDVTHDPRVHNHAWAEELGLVSCAGYRLRNEKNEPIGVLAMFARHPITEEDDAVLLQLSEAASRVILKTRADEALEAAKTAAELANRAKSEFLANMSHEIRTPMTAILGFTDLLLEHLTEPEAIEAAEIVKRNGKHLLAIINDILDLSKIEADKLQVEKTPWSPRRIVAEVVSLMRVRARDKGLTLTDEYVGQLPETILTDPQRLRQILINLVGNAIKFTDRGGVRIVTRLIGAAAGEHRLQFDVVDSGIGMTGEQVGKLFKPFVQVDMSITRRFEGTGLGLVISSRLAELLGGGIEVESQPGVGSTFRVTVATGPLAGVGMKQFSSDVVVDSEPPARSSVESQQRLDCRVLLAEDGRDNQRLIAAVLRKAGADVTIAENGQEALEKALAACPGWGRRHDDPNQPFDVILMDMQMPVIDGYEAARRLRQEGYERPIIALTAHAMSGAREECLEAGCDDYLSKPIERQKLLEIVARHARTAPEHAETAGSSPGDKR
ncbi:MAG: hypothetical protein A2V98_02110 [Planctomycetes bacterium RBG_16_64_12]|nr:MAG: hypothetical protein A2V98_02110 [Planctomycetes bacterium RBG_16_64_12]